MYITILPLDKCQSSFLLVHLHILHHAVCYIFNKEPILILYLSDSFSILLVYLGQFYLLYFSFVQWLLVWSWHSTSSATQASLQQDKAKA